MNKKLLDSMAEETNSNNNVDGTANVAGPKKTVIPPTSPAASPAAISTSPPVVVSTASPAATLETILEAPPVQPTNEKVSIIKTKRKEIIIGISIILALALAGVLLLIFNEDSSGVARVYNAGVVEWNQNLGEDCITKRVCLAAAVKNGPYNSVSEDATDRAVSPKGTEWARGSCASASNFVPLFEAANNKYGENLVAEEGYCMHLIKDDLYFDVQFLTWGNNIYSYTRTPYQR